MNAMSTGSANDAEVPTVAPARTEQTRPFYWALRRELWENRSIYIAPLVVTAFVLFGLLVNMAGLPRRVRSLPDYTPASRHRIIAEPFSIAPAPIMLASFLVGMFYAIDALYGERRDRSLLFWKSLPVSDTTTVIAKASIPLVVLPVIAFALSLFTLIVLFAASTLALMASGVGPGALWAEVRYIPEPLIMMYGLTVHALWFAPIYGWLLMISAWARRLPLLWAASPLLLVGLESAVGGSFFRSALQYRVMGAMAEAFAPERGETEMLDNLVQLTPGQFLSSPGLWLGLIFAGAFIGAAIRLRRDREPI